MVEQTLSDIDLSNTNNYDSRGSKMNLLLFYTM